jgi:hypothetical protein
VFWSILKRHSNEPGELGEGHDAELLGARQRANARSEEMRISSTPDWRGVALMRSISSPTHCSNTSAVPNGQSKKLPQPCSANKFAKLLIIKKADGRFAEHAE